MKYKYLFIFITIVLSLHIKAQDSTQVQFLKQFKKSNYKEKVRLVASKDLTTINIIFPEVRDSLETIRKKVYSNTSSKEAKFLFDIIDAKVELEIKKNPARCYLILNYAIQKNAQNIDDSLTAMVMMKECLVKIGAYSEAFELNTDIDKKWNRRTNKTLTYGTVKSSLYSYLGLYSYAIQQRKVEFVALNDKTDLKYAQLYNDIGVFYNRMRKFDSAEVYFRKALVYIKKLDKKEYGETFVDFFRYLAESNIAVGYIENGRYQGAIPYLKNDIYYSLKTKEYESAFNAYVGIINCYLKLKDLSIVKKYIDSLDRLSPELFAINKYRLMNYQIKAQYYKAINDYKLASDYYEKYIILKDSSSRQEKELQLINSQIAFDVQKKEMELQSKSKQLEISRIHQSKERMVRIYLTLSAIFLGGWGFFLFYYNKKIKRQKDELENTNAKIGEQNKTIQSALKEKETLIKEIHHRVKNNLQIINSIIHLQMDKLTDKNAINLLNDISGRITSIALTHQMLYQKDNMLSITVKEYIESLARQMHTMYATNNINMEFDIQDTGMQLDIDNAVPLGLIISEIITNSYKYAFPNNQKGVIKISYYKEGEKCFLTIKDNGIGIKEAQINNAESLGMELIKILCSQLNAQYSIYAENGTVFQLIIDLSTI